MAEIKLDNLSGDLTLMQSAADGLGLTIGEVFMPQIRGLVQAGTGVLTWVNEMIEAHPVMAKAILGAAGAVGVATTAIVAYNGAKKAMEAIKAVSPSPTERGWYISRSFTRREVARMGQKLLRFAVCLVLTALLLVYLAPKAC